MLETLVGRMANLYAFIDESGDGGFTPKGSKYFSVTSMLLTDPNIARDELFRLRHQIIEEGQDLEYFHATTDRQVDRDRVFAILQQLRPEDCRADTVLLEKAKANPTVRVPERYYCDTVELVLKHQMASYGKDIREYDRLLVFLDRPSQRGKEFNAMLKALKTKLPKFLHGVPYSLHFHASMSHHGLQMVDYLSWSVSVKYERGEFRPMESVKHLVKTEFDMYRRGTTIYYKK